MPDLQLVTLNGGATSISDEAVDDFRSRLSGELIDPGDDRYAEARLVWNGMIDRRPALIARCARVEDVVASVRFARENEILVAVRGGGHGVAGNAVCDGGLVIDLSPMTAVLVDADRRIARAEGGSRLADVDRATQLHGLAAPLGVVSRTGIAGLTLAGGMGWLRRKHGLSIDNLVSAEVVTADGLTLTASETENEALFWGLRGGGGNFGIVTSFEYRLHAVGPEVMTLFVLYPGERARQVIEAYREVMAAGDENFSGLCFLGRVPEADMFPAESHGKPYAALAGPYVGTVEEGERAMRGLRELGDPIADLSGPLSYVETQSLLDEDYPDGWQYYWKSLEFDALTDEIVGRLIDHSAAAPSHHSTVDVWYNGGAMSRVPADATAFGPRAPILLGYEANFEEPGDAEANVAWVRNCLEDVRPLSTGGAYLNFPGFFEEGEELLRASYGDANYQRLVALKDEYDPGNVFRLNGNIRPTV
jgi:FAD/FMN-containing dehydrogenase